VATSIKGGACYRFSLLLDDYGELTALSGFCAWLYFISSAVKNMLKTVKTPNVMVRLMKWWGENGILGLFQSYLKRVDGKIQSFIH
jgi:hypothetical protein